MLKKILTASFIFVFTLSLSACAKEKLPPRGASPANPSYQEPQTYDFKNQPDGFNGIKWGMSLAEAEKTKGVKFELVSDVKDLGYKLYTIPGDKNEIFGVVFPRITYSFQNGKFDAMNIQIGLPDPDRKIHKKLFDALVERHGHPTRIDGNQHGEYLEWRGTRTYITLNYFTRTESTSIWYMSPTIAYFSVYQAEKAAQKQKTAN